MKKKPEFKNWMGDIRAIKTGDGFRVRVDGCDISDPINEFDCKGLRSFELAAQLPTIGMAQAVRAEWLIKQLSLEGHPRVWPEPLAHDSEGYGPIHQYGPEVFVWYDEAGLLGGVNYSLEAALGDVQRYAESLNEPKRVPIAWYVDAQHSETGIEYRSVTFKPDDVTPAHKPLYGE